MPASVGCQRSRDGITSPVSTLKPDIVITSEIDAWHYFIDDDMFTLVANNTNIRISETVSKIKDSHTWLSETDTVELRAYFGLAYARGLLGQNLHSVNLLFSEHSHFVFGTTMSRNRMTFLYAHLTFDTLEQRTIAWPKDRFAAFRTFWEMFNSIYRNLFFRQNIFPLTRLFIQ